MLKSLLLKRLVPCTLVLAPTLVLAQTERELDVHVHGAASLQLVLEGNTLLINLESPAANLVGFEHAPETPDEKKQIENVEAMLAETAGVFGIPDSAECTTQSAVVNWLTVGEDDHDHDKHEEHAKHDDHDEHDEHDEHAKHDDHDGHDHDDHADEEDGAGHSEFRAAYTLECGEPGNIDVIDVLLFKVYPALETLSVQAVLPSGQMAVTLNKENSSLSIAN